MIECLHHAHEIHFDIFIEYTDLVREWCLILSIKVQTINLMRNLISTSMRNKRDFSQTFQFLIATQKVEMCEVKAKNWCWCWCVLLSHRPWSFVCVYVCWLFGCCERMINCFMIWIGLLPWMKYFLSMKWIQTTPWICDIEQVRSKFTLPFAQFVRNKSIWECESKCMCLYLLF